MAHPDIEARERAFRLAIRMASVSFASALTAAADNIRYAASDDAFLMALRDEPTATLNILADLIEKTINPHQNS